MAPLFMSRILGFALSFHPLFCLREKVDTENNKHPSDFFKSEGWSYKQILHVFILYLSVPFLCFSGSVETLNCFEKSDFLRSFFRLLKIWKKILNCSLARCFRRKIDCFVGNYFQNLCQNFSHCCSGFSDLHLNFSALVDLFPRSDPMNCCEEIRIFPIFVRRSRFSYFLLRMSEKILRFYSGRIVRKRFFRSSSPIPTCCCANSDSFLRNDCGLIVES